MSVSTLTLAASQRNRVWLINCNVT